MRAYKVKDTLRPAPPFRFSLAPSLSDFALHQAPSSCPLCPGCSTPLGECVCLCLSNLLQTTLWDRQIINIDYDHSQALGSILATHTHTSTHCHAAQQTISQQHHMQESDSPSEGSNALELAWNCVVVELPSRQKARQRGDTVRSSVRHTPREERSPPTSLS